MPKNIGPSPPRSFPGGRKDPRREGAGCRLGRPAGPACRASLFNYFKCDECLRTKAKPGECIGMPGQGRAGETVPRHRAGQARPLGLRMSCASMASATLALLPVCPVCLKAKHSHDHGRQGERLPWSAPAPRPAWAGACACRSMPAA